MVLTNEKIIRMPSLVIKSINELQILQITVCLERYTLIVLYYCHDGDNVGACNG